MGPNPHMSLCPRPMSAPAADGCGEPSLLWVQSQVLSGLRGGVGAWKRLIGNPEMQGGTDRLPSVLWTPLEEAFGAVVLTCSLWAR
jgi:hypothetical protein